MSMTKHTFGRAEDTDKDLIAYHKLVFISIFRTKGGAGLQESEDASDALCKDLCRILRDQRNGKIENTEQFQGAMRRTGLKFTFDNIVELMKKDPEAFDFAVVKTLIEDFKDDKYFQNMALRGLVKNVCRFISNNNKDESKKEDIRRHRYAAKKINEMLTGETEIHYLIGVNRVIHGYHNKAQNKGSKQHNDELKATSNVSFLRLKQEYNLTNTSSADIIKNFVDFFKETGAAQADVFENIAVYGDTLKQNEMLDKVAHRLLNAAHNDTVGALINNRKAMLNYHKVLTKMEIIFEQRKGEMKNRREKSNKDFAKKNISQNETQVRVLRRASNSNK